nr:response regulator [Candidatus Sigynarchaeota archaeon]
MDNDGSKKKILIVDDNKDILNNLEILLEFNDFKVISAINGKEALRLLEQQENIPDVIISDIVMPEMNGYDFFKAVSKLPSTYKIPFIFLAAKSAPEDIRLAKMLGADDYIVKPFNHDDLLAIISGKIARNKRIERLNMELDDRTRILAEQRPPKTGTSSLWLVHAEWNDKIGPVPVDHYPRDEAVESNKLTFQLFNMASAIYGDNIVAGTESVLLTLANMNKQALVMFDAYPDASKRARHNLYMLGAIAPKISYMESLTIKNELETISLKIKAGKKYDMRALHERLIAELSWS